jgi:Mg/Co/Ni transporter MgtE
VARDRRQPRPGHRDLGRRGRSAGRPADLATTVEELPPSRRSQIAAALDDEELADLLEEMPEQDQVRLSAGVRLERGADVVEEMHPDDAADLLAELPAEQRERLLMAMESVQAEDLRRLLRCGPETAAGLMTAQPLIVTPDTPVSEVLARIKDPDLPVTVAAQEYVCELPMVTPSGGCLGRVGFQRLLRRPPPPWSVSAWKRASSSGLICPSATW